MAQVSLDAMYERHSFIDEKRRLLLAALRGVNSSMGDAMPEVRIVLDGDGLGHEDCELWLYAGRRSARVVPISSNSVRSALLLDRTQLASTSEQSHKDAGTTLARWASGLHMLRDFTEPALTLDLLPFAEEFERGRYSAWHWGNVMLQAATDPILQRHLPLIERLSADPVTSRFFSFTSLDRLCLSRSSLYPFDRNGLPLASPARSCTNSLEFVISSGALVTDGPPDAQVHPLSASEAFVRIREVLALDPGEPYHGNIEDRLGMLLNSELAALNSELRVKWEQSRQWLQLRATGKSGRNCRITSSGPGRDGVGIDWHPEQGPRMRKLQQFESPHSAALSLIAELS